ncbi:MAG: aminotransferase class I/II-fold pyridoxal phosphate-dependent enzyme [Bacteroidetes bacterium]|nr:aminotransferase class I/II-fold pyridoxal phosphate-dependent enzyme [Bacteroidota bacterium]MDA1267984.1 aminotransferase class I/II-fold pyridoxal phosphate-dependent enzyme [Bacteroidota bacterium]
MKPQSIHQRLEKTVFIEGKEYLFFNGTSYLGIDSLEEYKDLLAANLQHWGMHHGLSRVNNLRLSLFDAFEDFFSKQAGAEEAALFSSGYLAGIAASQWLYPKAGLCWAAPDTHPAILPLGVVVGGQAGFKDWAWQCVEHAAMLPPQKILILGNAVDPLQAVIHDYEWVRLIADKHEVTVLIDDSHAFGVMGKGLFGTYSQWLHPDICLVVSGSLGKGLAMPGGIVLGPFQVVDGIKSQAIFKGASPASPAPLQSFLDAQLLYEQQRTLLRELTSFFHQHTQEIPQLSGGAHFPVFVYHSDSWAELLFQQGIVTSSFAYPYADSPRVNRIVLSAAHSYQELKSLKENLHLLSTSP